MDANYPLEYWKEFDGPFPQMMFCDNAMGLFSAAVKIRTKGYYGHFCWLVGRDEIASQSWWFQRQKLEHYRGCYVKFVHNPSWSESERRILLASIWRDLAMSPWKTRYDVIGVVGELFGITWMNRRGLDFCSERGKYLKRIDPAYNLKHPSPTELNDWTKQSGRYEVSGRYAPG